MRHFFLLFFSQFLILFSAFADNSFAPEKLEGKTYAERYYYLELVYSTFLPSEDSLRFYNRIEEIAQLAEINNNAELLLEADLLKVSYFIYHHASETDKCQSLINRLIEKVKEQNNSIFLARVYATAANYFWVDSKNCARAFDFYQLEHDLIKTMEVEEYPGKQKAIYTLASRYYDFKEYRKAIPYFIEAMSTDAYGELLYFTLQSTNTAGLCYQHLNQLDSADYYFSRANAVANTVGNEAWDGITSGNLGYNQFLRGNYSEAKQLLQKDVDLSLERHDWGCASGAMLTLAEISLMEGDVELAKDQLKKAHTWGLNTGQQSRLKNLYVLYSKLYIKEGNSSLAVLYQDSTKLVNALINKNFEAKQMLLAKQQIELEKEKKKEYGFSKIFLGTIKLFALLVLISLILFATRIFYRHYKNGIPFSSIFSKGLKSMLLD